MAYLATSARVVGGAAGDHEHLVDLAQLVLAHAQLVEQQPRPGRSPRGLLDGQRLLVHLLEHEVLVAALLGRRQVPVDVVLVGRHRVAVQVGHVEAFGGHDHHLVVLQDHPVLGVVEEGGEVAGHEVLPVGLPRDQGQVLLGPDHHPRVVLVEHGQRERPLEPLQRRAHRVRERQPLGQGGLTTRWATHSVSVWEANRWPSASSWATG
jgi:hypothetical protein